MIHSLTYNRKSMYVKEQIVFRFISNKYFQVFLCERNNFLAQIKDFTKFKKKNKKGKKTFK